MPNIRTRRLLSHLKAFTMLESLLVLAITCFLAIVLSSSVTETFSHVEEQIFFLEFESLYKDSQQLAISSNQSVCLSIAEGKLTNGYQVVPIPDSIKVSQTYQITFNQQGGNSSLATLEFLTPTKTIRYQLYIGSGRYKKTESERLHSNGESAGTGNLCSN